MEKMLESTDNKKYIGFIGPIGSGKSTACDFFKTHDYQVVSLSDVIREYVRLNNLPEDRDTLTHYSNKLKEEHGITYFAQTMFSKVTQKKFDQVVFDSIRHPSEAQFLKKNGVFLVGICANQEKRFDRITKRQHGTDFVDLATFTTQDNHELSGTNKGQSVEACYEFCDVIINNDQSLDYFLSQLNSVLDSMVVS